jgi:hypothetical protein
MVRVNCRARSSSFEGRREDWVRKGRRMARMRKMRRARIGGAEDMKV